MYERRAMVLMLGSALAIAGCSATATGGPGAQVGAVTPVTLTVASGNSATTSAPALQKFIDLVADRTKGRVVVSLSYVETSTATSTEPMLVQDVAGGGHDLGWVPARSLPMAGVPVFAALVAPGLIDDYAVQRAVITSDLPSQLLPATRAAGVDGLAVLGDHLRSPMGGRAPLRSLADITGSELWVNTVSTVERDTVRALGGTVSTKPFKDVQKSLSAPGFGAVLDANNVLDNGVVPGYLTPNLVLWPKLMVLVAHPGSLARLSAADAAVVRSAAHDASAYSVTVGPGSDADQWASLCGLGTHVVMATDTQLEQIDAAVAPVFAELRRERTTAAALDRISAIKQNVVPQPVRIPSACTGATTSASPPPTSTATPAVPSRPAAVATVFDGTYRQVVTASDLRRVGFTERLQPNGRACVDDAGIERNCLVEDAGTFTYTFDHGRYAWTQRQPGAATTLTGTGYYVVDGSALVIVGDEPRPDGTPFDQHFRWARGQDDSVTLTVQDEWNVSRQMASTPWVALR